MGLGLLFSLMVIMFAILDLGDWMRNVLYCIKETAIMFAMVVMVMAAAAGGTFLLLHTL